MPLDARSRAAIEEARSDEAPTDVVILKNVPIQNKGNETDDWVTDRTVKGKLRKARADASNIEQTPQGSRPLVDWEVLLDPSEKTSTANRLRVKGLTLKVFSTDYGRDSALIQIVKCKLVSPMP